MTGAMTKRTREATQKDDTRPRPAPTPDPGDLSRMTSEGNPNEPPPQKAVKATQTPPRELDPRQQTPPDQRRENEPLTGRDTRKKS